MTKVILTSSELACAFPVAVREDALLALSHFPTTRSLGGTFSVSVGNEVVILPTRIHNELPVLQLGPLNQFGLLTNLQREFIDCLLTRHTDGFVREKHLARIIGSSHVWVPPFVIRLVGEYVAEILRVVHQNLNNLDAPVYASFLRGNQGFFATIERRVASYWNCYYRSQRREEYVGFQLLDFFRSLMDKREPS